MSSLFHRLRPRENPETVPERPKTVLVKLSSFQERMECVRAAPRLKGTNVYINEDVSRATEKRKNWMNCVKNGERAT